MNNLRLYGNPPYTAAVIHGGPGAPGSMAPVARELSQSCGILEPLQTAASLDGQIVELRDVLIAQAARPLTLIGWSWGALLSLIFTAHHPELVQKLILIGSGGLEARHAAPVMQTRLSRLCPEDRAAFDQLSAALDNPNQAHKDSVLAELGRLFQFQTDTLHPISLVSEALDVSYTIHMGAWADASQLRASGALLDLARQIRCPVLALHGDYDPHPLEGVQQLADLIPDFRLIVLDHCGHYPWNEQDARDPFFEILRKEIQCSSVTQ